MLLLLLLWMFQRFGRSRRWLVDWSSLSTDPGGWRREEIEIAFRCCPVHARRDRRQNSWQQIVGPRQTWREIRDQIRLQRIQSRVPPAQRNQSGIDPFVLIQGKILGPVYAKFGARVLTIFVCLFCPFFDRMACWPLKHLYQRWLPVRSWSQLPSIKWNFIQVSSTLYPPKRIFFLSFF